MIYARIDLSKTNYEVISEYRKLKLPPVIPSTLEAIYNAYCVHKKFKSVMPIFEEEYYDNNNEVFGYYNKEEKLVAFSLLRCYNKKNVEAVQFAWDYENPKLRLGIESMKTECAIYKELGYKIIILGESHNYKRSIDGFKIFGKENLGSTNTV